MNTYQLTVTVDKDYGDHRYRVTTGSEYVDAETSEEATQRLLNIYGVDRNSGQIKGTRTIVTVTRTRLIKSEEVPA